MDAILLLVSQPTKCPIATVYAMLWFVLKMISIIESIGKNSRASLLLVPNSVARWLDIVVLVQNESRLGRFVR